MSTTPPDQIAFAEQTLEEWVYRHARAGVPELVLVELLREQVLTIEQRGYVPRRPDVSRRCDHRRPARSER